jgi:hypothetical protein
MAPQGRILEVTCPNCVTPQVTRCLSSSVVGLTTHSGRVQALMLAASVDSTDAVKVLLEARATLELQVRFFTHPSQNAASDYLGCLGKYH